MCRLSLQISMARLKNMKSRMRAREDEEVISRNGTAARSAICCRKDTNSLLACPLQQSVQHTQLPPWQHVDHGHPQHQKGRCSPS